MLLSSYKDRVYKIKSRKRFLIQHSISTFVVSPALSARVLTVFHENLPGCLIYPASIITLKPHYGKDFYNFDLIFIGFSALGGTIF